jgi:uncharacterized protein YjiS (DUF1127 family)
MRNDQIDCSQEPGSGGMPMRLGLRRMLAGAGGLFVWLDDHLTAARQRRLLRTMDDHMLKDIGLSRADAEREGMRGFFDVDGCRQP